MPRSPVQQRLSFPEPPSPVTAAGREEPTLWVRRVVLWHDASQLPVRDIALRRGLNIIYSPTGDGPDALATGHAAGKTLLCRLLRYCLGEDTYADPNDMAAIRKRFPAGAVGAEVRLRGESWVVRRGFASVPNDRALRSVSFDPLSDDALAGSFSTFVTALEATIFDEAQRALLADMEDVQAAWQYVLAWMTRDQECRIDGLTHWRHKDSSSLAAVRAASGETRLNVLRVAIGLYSEAASEIRKQVATTSSDYERLRTRTRRLERDFEALRDELAHTLDVNAERVWPPPVDLLQTEDSAQEAHRRTLMDQADQRIRSIAPLSIDPGRARDDAELERVAGELARISHEIANLTKNLEFERERARLLEGAHTEHWTNVRRANHPTCPYDDTPLDVKRAQFVCPLPRLPDPVAARKLAEETKEAVQQVLSKIARDEKTLGTLSQNKASLQVKVEALNRKIRVHELAIASATRSSQAAWATKGRVNHLFELHTELDHARAAEAEAKKVRDLHQDRQSSGLKEFRTLHLQKWFDRFIKRIVAPEATGTVVLDGNGLHPCIEWRGRRRSVALNSLQIVLFDLAAMLCAVEGLSHAPAFLMHDSPREGDLDPNTYGRIFHAVDELGPDEESAPFQYILTTTTKPPDEALGRVRLEIASDTDEHRLFRVDL